MAKTIRISLLLLVLLAVSQSAWKARQRTIEWSETLRVVVYPINGDGSAASAAYIGGLHRDVIEPLRLFMREQAQHHRPGLRDPIEVYLAPTVIDRPPLAPQTVRRHSRVDRGPGQVREHQSIVCQSHPALGLPVTDDCRSHLGR
jgi:hypothetical protein